MSTKILYNRYNHLLKPFESIKPVSDMLFSQDMLTNGERVIVLSQVTLSHGKHALCQVLSEKTPTDYVRIARILTNEQKRQSSEVLLNGEIMSTSTSSSATTTTTISTSSEGSQDSEVTEGGLGEEYSTTGSSTTTAGHGKIS